MQAVLENDLLPTKIAATLSGYTADYLARLARAKKVEGVQVGRAWLIRRASLEAFIAEQMEHKQQLARELARQRKEEYRAANVSSYAIPETATRTSVHVAAPASVAAVAPVAERAFSEALVRFAKGVETNVLRGPVPAFAVMAIVFFGSNYLASSALAGALVGSTESVTLTAASGARMILQDKIAALSAETATVLATESELHTQALQGMQTEVASPVLARAASLPYFLESDPSAGVGTIQPVSQTVSARTNVAASSIVAAAAAANTPDLFTLTSAAQKEVSTLAQNPFNEAMAVPGELSSAYRAVGVGGYELIRSVFSSYRSGLTVAGNGTLSLVQMSAQAAQGIPPSILEGQVAVGKLAVAASSGLIVSYTHAVEGYVAIAPNIPGATLAFVYNLGVHTNAVTSHIVPELAFAYSKINQAFTSDSGYHTAAVAAISPRAFLASVVEAGHRSP